MNPVRVAEAGRRAFYDRGAGRTTAHFTTLALAGATWIQPAFGLIAAGACAWSGTTSSSQRSAPAAFTCSVLKWPNRPVMSSLAILARRAGALNWFVTPKVLRALSKKK